MVQKTKARRETELMDSEMQIDAPAPVAVAAAQKSPSQLAHELSDFAHARGALLAKGLIDGGQLAQAGAIATAAETLCKEIKAAFPYA